MQKTVGETEHDVCSYAYDSQFIDAKLVIFFFLKNKMRIFAKNIIK